MSDNRGVRFKLTFVGAVIVFDPTTAFFEVIELTTPIAVVEDDKVLNL